MQTAVIGLLDAWVVHKGSPHPGPLAAILSALPQQLKEISNSRELLLDWMKQYMDVPVDPSIWENLAGPLVACIDVSVNVPASI